MGCRAPPSQTKFVTNCRKLGNKVARRTIQRYLWRIKPPRASNQTWSTFLHSHVNDVWVCDFWSVIELTFRTRFVLFIIELSLHRVVHFGVTRHPTQEWFAQQLQEAILHFVRDRLPNGVHPRFILRDNDRKFGTAFDRVAQHTGIELLQIPYRAPRANAVCERFLGSVRRECLDYFLILSERQLYRVVREYVSYINRTRPHQGLQQQIPEEIPSEVIAPTPNKIILFPGLKGKELEGPRSTAAEAEAHRREARGKIIGFPILNGLPHHYRRVA